MEHEIILMTTASLLEMQDALLRREYAKLSAMVGLELERRKMAMTKKANGVDIVLTSYLRED